ncbi:hypothetical protein KUTeg_010135 [Tegillarca granosa]|uniref:RRM domain-containing protein n=1 Tax=Tegillarca granosa TaxID=220873 RepID=A0ABQ9FA96_TEGGR|nr:hypothetical protein KUTeg_010135 [Tegillarca granosa]
METAEGSSYKNLKKTKQKSMAASAHNWNTLFLGANAVADVMAEKYSTSKSQILDAESKQSLGVRMALGETQLVSETRDFLLENGVSLDSFSQFQHVPLYLEWAPVDVFMKKSEKNETEKDKKEEEANVFEQCGKVKSATIAKKKDIKNPEFKNKRGVEKAMRELQHTVLDGHTLELKISNRSTLQPKSSKKPEKTKLQDISTKILVRNIPVFGELKSVRLPKKLSGTGSHRGFGFRAFEALCHSTHLFGRRLVLEWAQTTEDLDELRKKTAKHYHEDVPKKKLKKSSIMEDLDMAE